MRQILIFIFVFLISLAGVEIFRRWSLRHRFLDVPNERSSHTNPTPRGGGLIIVFVSLAAYFIYTNYFFQTFKWSYFLGAALIAFISWLDDLFDISFVWRFLVHSAAALIVIYNLGYFQLLYIPYFGQIEVGFFGIILTFLWIVWLTNAYNFMDGIDGIAATQAISAGIGWLVIGKILGLADISFYGGVIAFSSLGFLIENWHPAKIFMGDVGSAFLGFTFAVFPLLAIWNTSKNQAILPILAVLLVGLFVFDTILTFVRRIIKKEKIWQAHRSHIYQRLFITGSSQAAVTGLYGLSSFITVILIAICLSLNEFWSILLLFTIFEFAALFVFLNFREKKKVLT